MIQPSYKKFSSKTILRLFGLSLFLLPFTGTNSVSIHLQAVGKQMAMVPIAITVMLFVFYKIKTGGLRQDFRLVKPLFFLCGFAVFSFLIKIHTIASSELMGQTGLMRFALQYAQLLFCCCIVLMITYIIDTPEKMDWSFRMIKGVVLLIVVYALIELAAYVDNGPFLNTFSVVDAVFHGTNNFYGQQFCPAESILPYRLRSFSQEPSHLGILFSFMFPILLVKCWKRDWITLMLFFVVGFFTFSRTLYVTLLVEIIGVVFLYKYKFINLKYIFRFIPLLIILLFSTFSVPELRNQIMSSFDIENSSSSHTRILAKVCAILGWDESGYYVTGEGLGQHGYYSINFYNMLEMFSSEFRDVSNEERWPFIQDIHIKMLVELGVAGFAIWLSCYFYLIFAINRIIMEKYQISGVTDMYGQAIIIAVCGMFVSGFAYENLYFCWTWIPMGIAYAYIRMNRSYLKKPTPEQMRAGNATSLQTAERMACEPV